MTSKTYTSHPHSLSELGFSTHFLAQMSLEELERYQPMRVVEVQRNRLYALSEGFLFELTVSGSDSTGSFVVGDWVLTDEQHRVIRVLQPKSSLKRRAAGTNAAIQGIANNIDTLFIVTSCNADFNEARLERYLALSKEAGVEAVILLTKADLSDQVAQFEHKAKSLMNNVMVLPLDVIDGNIRVELKPWCSSGQTVALVGSSGVGKTTIMNMLTGDFSATQGIRENDSKGKHTTTFRSMRFTKDGGWVIDTPGMRALRLHNTADGIAAVFDEINHAAAQCRYTDCQHVSEPGCAVQLAIEQGELDSDRLKRWRKLQREDRHNTQSVAEARKRDKQFSKKSKQCKQERKRTSRRER
ncbi:ribosome small subunit-dependent GTPase A [bacterium]|nr:ribosome small subunit-dependent GTPase A [bacterium]